MIYTTLNAIREADPCEDSWKRGLVYLGKTRADDEPLGFDQILDVVGLIDTLWCCQTLDSRHDRDLRLYAVWCARRVCSEEHEDVLRVAEQYAIGNASQNELDGAWSAEWGAAWNAEWGAAWSAEWRAVWRAEWSDAQSAAQSAAWSAEWRAEWGAAWRAAGSAARSAAWNAAQSAAQSAAWGAAKNKERLIQTEEFRLLLDCSVGTYALDQHKDKQS